MFGLKPIELVLILLILLVLFGAKKLPEMGKGLGKGIREFRDATKGLNDDLKDDGDPAGRTVKPSSDAPKQE
jgi:sec-independent protein translocase protein TatA